VNKAAGLGLSVIAICDHDTVNGIAAALKAAAGTGLKVIPGVELSTHAPGSEVHMLGYFVDHTDPGLLAALAGLRNSRRERAQAMIARLGELGLHIDWQRVQQIAGVGSVGRPHIAQAILEKGYVASFKEVFTSYLGFGGPAYVERQKMTPQEAIALIIKAGGLPVLAHPTTVSDPEKMIAGLKAAGLVGIEVYYNNYTDEQRNGLTRLAAKYDLIATGGSDYHGLGEDETMLGEASVPPQSAEQLIARRQQPAAKPARH
jgi:hypothetical protein